MGRFPKKHLFELFLYAALAAGLGIMLYPTFSDWWNSFHQSRAIADYDQVVDNTTAEERQAMLQAAREYNERLAAHESSFVMDEQQQAEYNSLLDVSGTGVMAHIHIPSINVQLPVYHTVEESVLQVGVGHIPGSSLPVGGPGTHSLLSGHRGLPSARLFTDLNQLKEGDIFLLSVLGETLTYEVDQIRIILPEEVGDLSIVPGMDYCTLITCTPYGVNTHRILLRGHRVENRAGEITVTAEASRVPPSRVIPVLAIPLVGVTVVLMLVFGRRRPGRKNHQQLLEELKTIDKKE